MTLNVALLEQTMQHIVDHPEQHDQKMYVTDCGTPSCFAGWALHLNGTLDQVKTTTYFDILSQVQYDAAAQDALGITYSQAYSLFAPDNTVERLQELVKDYVNTAGVIE